MPTSSVLNHGLLPVLIGLLARCTAIPVKSRVPHHDLVSLDLDTSSKWAGAAATAGTPIANDDKQVAEPAVRLE